MSSHFTLTLDTQAPANPAILLSSGAAVTGAREIAVALTTTDYQAGARDVAQMKIWGDSRYPQGIICVMSWHQKYESCQGCCTTDRKHWAKGLCQNCYTRLRRGHNPQVRVSMEERGRRISAAKTGQSILKGRWSLQYDACQGCGTTDRPHSSLGLCSPCYNRAHRVKNIEAQILRERTKLCAKHGWTLQNYEATLAAQGGGCAICGRTTEANGKALSIDHDHVTGAPRGILCHAHNAMLGMASDSPEALRAGAAYLEAHRV